MRNVFPAILDLFPANLEGNSLFPSKLAGNRIYFLLNLAGNRLFPLIFISHYFLFSLFVSYYFILKESRGNLKKSLSAMQEILKLL